VSPLKLKHCLQYKDSSQITDLPFSAYQNGFLADCQDETVCTEIYGDYQNIEEMRYIHLLPKYVGKNILQKEQYIINVDSCRNTATQSENTQL
jgi:hypothetical protein